MVARGTLAWDGVLKLRLVGERELGVGRPGRRRRRRRFHAGPWGLLLLPFPAHLAAKIWDFAE